MSRKQPWLARDAGTKRELEHLTRQGVEHKSELIKRLKILSARGMCPEQAVAWLKTEAKAERRKRFVFSENANARVGEHPALELLNLQRLQDGALLTLSVLVDKTTRLIAYNVGLQGTARTTKARWYARVDLTENSEGEGPCGHPLLHCHVGADPSAMEEPETRVPLPFLTPAEALDWLLATADPTLEPTDIE